MIRSQPCPACGTEVHADVAHWVYDLERRLAKLTDRHQPSSYPGPDGVTYCNACGMTAPCPDARILAGLEISGQED